MKASIKGTAAVCRCGRSISHQRNKLGLRVCVRCEDARWYMARKQQSENNGRVAV